MPERSGAIPTVVVGVDASDESRQALRWAAAYARGVGARLAVVHAWHPAEEYVWLPEMPPPAPPTEVASTAVGEMVADVLGAEPGIDVAVEVIEGHAARVLVDRSRDADLLVVGSRGHGGFDGLTLGSVSAQCAEHAQCSVVVVRPPAA